MVGPLLLRSSVTFYRQHPLQLVLSVLGIILGVCIVTAVWITNSSSKRAFALSTESLYGRTTHHIVAADGVDQTVYAGFRKTFPHILAAPIIEGHALIDNNVFSLLGVDPFSEISFQRVLVQSANSDSYKLDASGLLLSRVTSERLNLSAGDVLSLRTGNDLSLIHI